MLNVQALRTPTPIPSELKASLRAFGFLAQRTPWVLEILKAIRGVGMDIFWHRQLKNGEYLHVC